MNHDSPEQVMGDGGGGAHDGVQGEGLFAYSQSQ